VPILQSLDLDDISSLDIAITSFTNLGLTDIATVLTTVRDNISTNISLSISSMLAEASNVAKEVEVIVNQVGKGMEYSSALEEA